MAVSRNSWHYRWVMFWRSNGLISSDSRDTEPESLCEYVRWIVLWPAASVVVYSLIAVLAIATIPLWVPFLLIAKLWERRSDHNHSPNPIIEYAKAAHHRVCPIIEYTEQG